MTLSIELLPSLDWTLFEVDKFVVSVVDALLKNKIYLVQNVKYNKENYLKSKHLTIERLP
jgi:hypothetical protein